MTSQRLVLPFLAGGRVSRPLVLAFVLLHALVLANALLHDARIAYDARGHLKYVDTLASGRLPDREDTHEFFSAPLPYVVPAAVLAAARAAGAPEETAGALSRRAGQLANVGFSLLLVWCLLALGRLVEDETIHVRLVSLLLLGSMAAYYRMFANVRGEPLVASLGVALVWLVVSGLVRGDLGVRRGIAVGLVVGLLALARQWAVFVVAAVALAAGIHLLRHRERIGPALRLAGVGAAVAVLVAGGFYLRLQLHYGSVSVSNWQRDALPFRLSNHPPGFYLDPGLPELFTRPIYQSFPNRLIPMFYSTLWGDYWGYFVVASRDLRDGRFLQLPQVLPRVRREGGLPAWLATNGEDMAPHLGRVNAVSLLPTLVLLLGLGWGAVLALGLGGRPPPEREVARAGLLVVALSMAGYFWYLVAYPRPPLGNTIKAGYQLQVWPLWSLLAGLLVARVAAARPRLARGLEVALALVWLHHLPFLVTRFSPLTWRW